MRGVNPITRRVFSLFRFAFSVPVRREKIMSSKKTFHLFNCDQTFSLDVVDEFLNAVTDKLPDAFHVEHHPFPLSQMRALSEEVSTLKMDYAIFVVHAHESRLSINEENAGIGYAVLFKALLRATGNKVLVVIGGDDNYKNQDEEDTKVLSRWARHKIMSQFTEDFLDGSTSFIFSWEKKHRPIHEEALLHFLLPGNEGKKFEPKPRPPKPEPVVTSTNPAQADVDRNNERQSTDNKGSKSTENRGAKPREPYEVMGQDSEEKLEHGNQKGKQADTAGYELQGERNKQLEKKGGELQDEPAATSNIAISEDVTEPQEGDEAEPTGVEPSGKNYWPIKTTLHYGELQMTDQQNAQVPAYIKEGLRDKYKDAKNAEVEIFKTDNGYNVNAVERKKGWWEWLCTIL